MDPPLDTKMVRDPEIAAEPVSVGCKPVADAPLSDSPRSVVEGAAAPEAAAPEVAAAPPPPLWIGAV